MLKYPNPQILDQEYFTIEEIIKCAAEAFDFKINKTKEDGEKTYKRISQRINRELEKMTVLVDGKKMTLKEYAKKTSPSPRKTMYSKDVVERLLSDNLFEYFLKQHDIVKREEHGSYEELCKTKKELKSKNEFLPAKKVPFVKGDEAERARLKELLKNNHPYDVSINSEIRARKIDIALDYIFSEFIDFKEELLRHDLSMENIYYPAYTDAVAYQAVNRLLDNRNYYEIKEHSNKSQKKK